MAQANVPVTWTHPDSGIVYSRFFTSSGMSFGYAMPSDALDTDAEEFIGYFVSSQY